MCVVEENRNIQLLKGSETHTEQERLKIIELFGSQIKLLATVIYVIDFRK